MLYPRPAAARPTRTAAAATTIGRCRCRRPCRRAAQHQSYRVGVTRWLRAAALSRFLIAASDVAELYPRLPDDTRTYQMLERYVRPRIRMSMLQCNKYR